MSTTEVRAVSPPRVTTKRQFFPELEGMRGLAAVGVLLTHVAFTAGVVRWNEVPGYTQQGHGIVSNIFQQLQFALPIFFVLSGVLLYRPFALATIAGTRTPATKPYLWRRFLRTVPAYWVLTGVVTFAFNRPYLHGTWSVLRQFLFLQVYQTDGYNTTNGMEQAWSLCTEILFYMTLPLMAWVLHRVARNAVDPWQKAKRIVFTLSPLFVLGLVFTAWSHLPSFGAWPIQGEWPICWYGFIAAGMSLAAISSAAQVDPEGAPRLYKLLVRRPAMFWLGAVAMYVLSVVSPVGDPGSSNYPHLGEAVIETVLYTGFALFAVAPLVSGGRSKVIAAVLRNPVVAYVGRISYGVYLWHIAVLTWFNHGSMYGGTSMLLLTAETLGGAIVLGTLSFYLIEKPGMQLRKRLGKAPVEPGAAVLVTEPAPAAEPVVEPAPAPTAAAA